MKKKVKVHMKSLFELVIQFSVAEFHSVKPGLIEHVLLVEM